MSTILSQLPPINPKRHLTSEVYFSNIPQPQRDRWKKTWARMDEEECRLADYGFYHAECRKTFEELEKRESQLAKALSALAEYREQHDSCADWGQVTTGPEAVDRRCSTCKEVDALWEPR